jgi:hypothetical protein
MGGEFLTHYWKGKVKYSSTTPAGFFRRVGPLWSYDPDMQRRLRNGFGKEINNYFKRP